MLRTRLSFTCLVFGVLGCSWTRFDDITSDSPVVLLNKPETLQSGFGVTLTAISTPDRSVLLSAGTANRSAAAVFDIGLDEEPSIDASEASYCGDRNDCYLGGKVAGLGRAKPPGNANSKNLCFGLGVGETDKPKVSGVLVRCENGFTYALTAPTNAEGLITDVLDDQAGVLVTLNAGPEREPALTVGAGARRLAWYYPSGGVTAFDLEVPDHDEASYGQTVASFEVKPRYVIAVGEPGEGNVWLFLDEAADDIAPIPLGCLSGPDDFGRTLAVGYITTDLDGDLVVADESKVYVFDGEVLADMAPPDDPSLTPDCVNATKHEALLKTLSCAETENVEGCSGSNFGAALAIGDLDGDGDGEVIVGAPNMKARGEDQAGAVLVYDIDGKSGAKLGDAKFLSSAESGDNLGAALAAPSVGKRDIIAAGAPGNGKTALFYCSALGGTSPRCQ